MAKETPWMLFTAGWAIKYFAETTHEPRVIFAASIFSLILFSIAVFLIYRNRRRA